MTFIQALYGSQYYEITQKGRDGNMGRFNGNIFLSAFVVLIIITITGLTISFSERAAESFERMVSHIIGYDSAKTTGKLLAIPVMACCYFIIANTTGSKKNFKKIIDAFNLLPVEEKKKANKKVLLPFFIVLGLFFGLVVSASLEN